MNDLNNYWERRKHLIAECHRCEESNRFIILATPLYILFPFFLIFVIPLYILFKRIRYLAMRQLKKDQEKFCTLISGGRAAEALPQTGPKL